MPKTQLPEYSSLVRWTVQDVVNWLVGIGFNDCSRPFREAGVDGNKLANITDVELRKISCPNRRIKDIVKFVNEVGPPPAANRAFMMRQAPAPVKKDYGAPAAPFQQPNDEGIASGSDDDIGWDEDFDSADEDSDQSYEEPLEQAPLAPPRPAARNGPGARPPVPTPVHQHQVRSALPQVPSLDRRPQPVPQFEQEEAYEDPDAGLPPTVPSLPTRRKPPSPPPVQEETYEDPDAAPPPVTTAPPRRKPLKAPSPPPVENGEEYEEPDPDLQPPVRRPQKPRIPVPPTPLEEDENYEEPESSRQLPGHRPPIPIPITEPDNQEVYEDPDSQVIVQPTHGGPLPTPPGLKPPGRNDKKEPPSKLKHGGLPVLPPPPKPKEPEPIEQDVYEIPAEEEAAPKLPPPGPGRRGLPPVPKEPEPEGQDDYLEMDTQVGPPPRKPQFPVAQPKEKPSAASRADRRRHPEPQPPPQLQEEETYEDPDPTPSHTPEPSSRRKKETKGPAGAVPILPGMKMLNINEEPKKKSLEKKTAANRPKKVLPPPPAAEEPAPEPVKPEPRRAEPRPVQNKTTEEVSEGDLDSYPWYHGQISRQQADARLKEMAVDGMYCIRKSSGGGDRPYTLAVFYENKVYNLPVRRRADRKYALGALKKGEHSFSTLLEMINFFKKNFLVIHASESGQTRLVKSLPKS